MLQSFSKFSGWWLRRATHAIQNTPIVQNAEVDFRQPKHNNSVIENENEGERNDDFDLLRKLLCLDNTGKAQHKQSSLSIVRVLSNGLSSTNSFNKWWSNCGRKCNGGFGRNFDQDASWWMGMFATTYALIWHRHFSNTKEREDLCPLRILTNPHLRIPIVNAVNSEKSASHDSVSLDSVSHDSVKSEASNKTYVAEEKLLENFDKSAERFEKVSDECYGDILFHQASEYRKNNHFEKAFEYFHTAVQYDHIPSMYNLGLCYENGHGVTVSLKKAAKLYRRAAEKGHLKSMFSVANLHYNFHNPVSDENKDIGYRYMKKAADEGLVEAQSFLALMFAEEDKLSEAFDYFEKAAKQKDNTSVYNLAVCYENGFGVVKDISKAMEYYQQSGEMGDVLSQFYLGESYQHGWRGVKKDFEESLKWYNLAAENGHSEAANILPLIRVKMMKEKSKRKAREKYIYSFMNLSQSLIEPKYNGNFHFSFDTKWLK